MAQEASATSGNVRRVHAGQMTPNRGVLRLESGWWLSSLCVLASDAPDSP